ncbi:MAG TPA: DUF72 domain-containing protein [Acidimicrobiales bacterium]|nr:DUF72 domain-containing protein [Acidimicrobiales bacterium]
MSETASLLDPGPQAAAPVRVGGAAVRAGTTSWADRSLVRDGSFYPRKTMTASARLAFYCAQLPLAEVATTFRFPPTPDLAAQWVARTPAGFTFDVQAWSLLVGAPTLPDSLWPDLQAAVDVKARDKRRLYAHHLPTEVLEECWDRFAHSLRPLATAGRLGVVTLCYPSWFSPRPAAWDELARLPARLPGVEVAVELRHHGWYDGQACDETLEWLEARGIGFVCVDRPAADGSRPVVAATSDVAVVRFRGRRCVEGEPSTWPYRYADDELAGWVPAIRSLAAGAREVHCIMDNCWRSDAVDGATTLVRLLTGPDVGDAA